MIARQCLAMHCFAVADIANLLVVDCPLSHKARLAAVCIIRTSGVKCFPSLPVFAPAKTDR